MNAGDALSRVREVESVLSQAGLPAPEPLVVALDAYNAAMNSQFTPFDSAHDCQTVTADDVDRLLERAALHEAMRVNSGSVRGEILDHLGRRVVREFVPMLDPIADRFAEQFDAEVPNFIELLSDLPGNHVLGNLEHVSQRGLLARWEQTRDSAQVLESLTAQRNALADLGYLSGLNSILDARTRFTDIEDPDTFDSLAYLESITGFGIWPELARRPGVTVRWVKPSEQRAMVERLNAARPAAKQRAPQPRPAFVR